MLQSSPPPATSLSLIRGLDVSRPRLTFACGFYDRTEPLRTGDVAVDDIDLDFQTIQNPREIFDRMGGQAGIRRLGILQLRIHQPIRARRLSVRGAAGVSLARLPPRLHLRQPQGRHPHAQGHGGQARRRAALYDDRRGLDARPSGAPIRRRPLDHHAGWRARSNHAGSHGEPSAPPLLKPVKIERDAKGRSLSELLAAGEIDAIIGTQHPNPHPDIAPMFADARAVERDFFIKTKIFPIMHLVVIRRDVYERDRSIAGKLFKAFVDAKNLALARMHKGHPFMLPWVHQDIHEIDERVRRRSLPLRHRGQPPDAARRWSTTWPSSISSRAASRSKSCSCRWTRRCADAANRLLTCAVYSLAPAKLEETRRWAWSR